MYCFRANTPFCVNRHGDGQPTVFVPPRGRYTGHILFSRCNGVRHYADTVQRLTAVGYVRKNLGSQVACVVWYSACQPFHRVRRERCPVGWLPLLTCSVYHRLLALSRKTFSLYSRLDFRADTPNRSLPLVFCGAVWSICNISQVACVVNTFFQTFSKKFSGLASGAPLPL